MIAVSDQGPLHYLILIGCDHVLPQLYERVIAPRVVIEKEMGDPATPEPVRTWAADPPPWLEILEPKEVEPIPPLSGRGDRGAGEIAAIALALELGTEDFNEPPARFLKRILGGHYKKTTTAMNLFPIVEPQVASDRCPHLKLLAEDLLRVAKLLQ